MRSYAPVKNMLSFIEAFIVWCAWMILGFLSGYMPGWRGGYTLWRYFELQKQLGEIPYAAIIALLKKHDGVDNSNRPEQERGKSETVPHEDILFYAFMMNRRVRLGLRALTAILVLCAAIFLGADWLVLYALIAILFLFGILQIAQGSMELFG